MSQPAANPEPSTPRRIGSPLAAPLWIVAICAAVTALRFGRELLVPVVQGALIALILSGIVERLHRYHIPRALSAAVLLLLGATALGVAFHAVAAPAQEWMESAPRVLHTIEQKTRVAQGLVRRLDAVAERARALAAGGGPHGDAPAPSPAQSVPVSAIDVVEGTTSVLSALLIAVAIAVLLLATGPPTLARMTAPGGSDGHTRQVLEVIQAIRIDVGRYYATLTVINLLFGTATAVVMWLSGMPNPPLWGAIAGALNFIPYVGFIATFAVVALVAFVSFPGIAHAALVAASFMLLAAIEGHVVEPVFLGRRLSLNPIVVLLALWFGAWLWGIAGMIVALPILVAIKVAASKSANGAALARFLSAPRKRPAPVLTRRRARRQRLRNASAHFPGTPPDILRADNPGETAAWVAPEIGRHADASK